MNVTRYLIRIGRLAVPAEPVPPPQLVLAGKPRWYRGAWVRCLRGRAWILVATVAAGAWGCAQVPYAFHQYRAMTYRLPPNTVVVDDDAGRAAELLNARRTPYGVIGYAGPPVGPWSAGRTAPPLIGMNRWSTGTLFSHGRRAPGHLRPLVVVFSPIMEVRSDGRFLVVYTTAARPATLRWGSRVSFDSVGRYEVPLPASRNFRFFAGQPDPSDPARFTINYDLDGVRGTIAGSLDARDCVRLDVASGPLRW